MNKITTIFKSHRMNLFSCMSASLALISFSACSSDDKDEPIDPETKIEDVYQRDKATGSISQKEFEEKVMNKVWYYPDGHDNDKWIDSDGNVYDWYYLCLTGWYSEFAYYFDSEKYVSFRRNLSVPILERREYDYKYDPETGMIYTDNGEFFDVDANNDVLFYIESVNDNEMIIHHRYRKDILDKESDHYILYGREPLKAASEEKAQKDWWDKYPLTQE